MKQRITKSTMEKVIKWFVSDNVGMSSQFMAIYLTTGEVGKFGARYPHDPSDFNRCLTLLEAAPELRDHMHKLSSVNKQWSELVENWDALEASFLNEVGLNWCNGDRAPITYMAMKHMGL